MKIRSDPAAICGSIASVVTPFTDDSAVDHASLRALIRFQLDLHYRLHPLVDLLFVETNPAPAKWVLHQQGLISSGYVRPPLVPPSEIGVARIRALLAEGGDLTAQI
jgi:dihydrodipicolinate synthase/N-acetylneuraminate lyase